MLHEDECRLRGLTGLLLDLRRQFVGDVDRALILLTMIVEDSQGEETGSASVIARMTGIPRESVRRKLEHMTGARQVVREAGGDWRVSDSMREILQRRVAASIPASAHDRGTPADDPVGPTGRVEGVR